MKKLLVINASARILRSHSRALTEAFVRQWEDAYPESHITFRELGTANVPHMTEHWISAAFKPQALRTGEDLQVLEASTSYVSELHDADVIVIGSPMYNWSIPSPLKAYIDQIMRINETWRPNASDQRNPYLGLLQNKTLVLLLSRGSAGYEEGEYNQHMNYQSTYLKTVFNIMGIHDIHVIAINGASVESDMLANSIEQSHRQIKEFITSNI
nr:NAD(P)H-dependent oxidoreductase [uncultured Dyadobacter sp.]